MSNKGKRMRVLLNEEEAGKETCEDREKEE